MAESYTDIGFCTVDKFGARYIAWQRRGFGHAYILSQLRPGMWLDSRGDGGVKYRLPETDLHRSVVIRLPIGGIERAGAEMIGTPYDWRGLVAFGLHFYWHSHGLFCSDFVRAAIEKRVGRIIDPAYRGQLDPVGLYHVITALNRGIATQR